MNNAFGNMNFHSAPTAATMSAPTASGNNDDFGDFEDAEPSSAKPHVTSSDPMSKLISLDGLSKNTKKEVKVKSESLNDVAAHHHQSGFQQQPVMGVGQTGDIGEVFGQLMSNNQHQGMMRQQQMMGQQMNNQMQPNSGMNMMGGNNMMGGGMNMGQMNQMGMQGNMGMGGQMNSNMMGGMQGMGMGMQGNMYNMQGNNMYNMQGMSGMNNNMNMNQMGGQQMGGMNAGMMGGQQQFR
jgi:hypothetical protein